MGILTTCSAWESSIRSMRLLARPMTRTSAETTSETIGAGGSNWTRPRSNSGVLAASALFTAWAIETGKRYLRETTY